MTTTIWFQLSSLFILILIIFFIIRKIFKFDIFKFLRPFLKLTAHSEKFPTDVHLDNQIGYVKDLLHVISPVLKKIIYTKIKLFFQYRWKFLLARTLVITLIGILSYYVLTTWTSVKITTGPKVITDTLVLRYKNDSSMNLTNFLKQISYVESRYDKKANNGSHYGLYQFNVESIKEGGYDDVPLDVFLRHHEMQDLCVINFLKSHKKVMQPYINKYCGKVIDGILVTESGILALSHLGCGAAKSYLDSGKIPEVDENGNHPRTYLKLGGYRLNLEKVRYSITDGDENLPE